MKQTMKQLLLVVASHLWYGVKLIGAYAVWMCFCMGLLYLFPEYSLYLMVALGLFLVSVFAYAVLSAFGAVPELRVPFLQKKPRRFRDIWPKR